MFKGKGYFQVELILGENVLVYVFVKKNQKDITHGEKRKREKMTSLFPSLRLNDCSNKNYTTKRFHLVCRQVTF